MPSPEEKKKIFIPIVEEKDKIIISLADPLLSFPEPAKSFYSRKKTNDRYDSTTSDT